MKTPLRFGILGCARISRRGLIPGIRESRGGRLDAIASRTLDNARAWADEFAIPKAYGSYSELIADPEIDAVYVPLPNELHLPIVLEAAKAGKHILCEKPLANSAEEAEAMHRACEDARVILMEAFMWRFQPRTTELLKLVRAGAIGDVRLVRSSFSFPIDPNDWRLDPRRGGGALWDVGCYGVSTVRLYTEAEPVSVQATARFGSTDVDMSLAAVFGFKGGAIGSIDCSFEQPFRCVYEVVGTNGSFVVPDAYLPPAVPIAILTDEDGTRELTFDGRNQYAAMVDSFVASVAAGKVICPGETGVEQMRVLDQVAAAARA